jgi:hypothetical protein
MVALCISARFYKWRLKVKEIHTSMRILLIVCLVFACIGLAQTAFATTVPSLRALGCNAWSSDIYDGDGPPDNLTVSLSTPTLQGDMLIAVMNWPHGRDEGAQMTTPPGWTTLLCAASPHGFVWYRNSPGGESSFQFDFPFTSYGFGVAVFDFSANGSPVSICSYASSLINWGNGGAGITGTLQRTITLPSINSTASSALLAQIYSSHVLQDATSYTQTLSVPVVGQLTPITAFSTQTRASASEYSYWNYCHPIGAGDTGDCLATHTVSAGVNPNLSEWSFMLALSAP